MLRSPKPPLAVRWLPAVALVLQFTALPAGAPAFAAQLEVTTNDEHLLTTLAPGVYAIRHKRAAAIGSTSGNTTLIVGEREALVVDATSSPTFARGDLAQFRQWTDKPVRWLVNTHWHGDHTWGNGVYADELEGVTVVSHVETARLMAGYLNHFLPQNLDLPRIVREMIASGRDDTGRPITEEEREFFRANLPHYEERAKEFAAVKIRTPTLTFERALEIDLGGRVVRLLHLGRGNTAGDAVVHLPAERIVVAGDLLVHPVPYLLGGFPREWAATLGALERLAPETIVPGHGAVQTGAPAIDYLRQVQDLLATIAHAVQEETFRVGNGPGNLEKVEAAVAQRSDIAALRARFSADDPEKGPWFDQNLAGVVASAYREAWGN